MGQVAAPHPDPLPVKTGRGEEGEGMPDKNKSQMPPLIPHGPELMQGFRRQRIKTKGAEIETAVGAAVRRSSCSTATR